MFPSQADLYTHVRQQRRYKDAKDFAHAVADLYNQLCQKISDDFGEELITALMTIGPTWDLTQNPPIIRPGNRPLTDISEDEDYDDLMDARGHPITLYDPEIEHGLAILLNQTYDRPAWHIIAEWDRHCLRGQLLYNELIWRTHGTPVPFDPAAATAWYENDKQHGLPNSTPSGQVALFGT